MKMTDNVEFFVSDVQGKVSKVAGLNTQLTPVSGHNFHGKVERIGRTFKESLENSGVNKLHYLANICKDFREYLQQQVVYVRR